jgi:O-antigen ligase
MAWALAAIGVLLAAVALWVLQRGLEGSLANAGAILKLYNDSYQAITFALGFSAVAIFSLLMATKLPGWAFLVLGGLWVAVMGSAAAAGGRGSAISSVIAQAVVLLYAARLLDSGAMKKRLAVTMAMVAAAVTGLVVISEFTRLTLFTRLLQIVANPNSDVTNRSVFWARALDATNGHPVFGWGLSSFSLLFGGVDEYGVYPHNVFLEALAETGIIGFALFSAVVGFAAYSMLAARRNLPFLSHAMTICLAIMAFSLVMVSDDVTSRILALAIGMCCGGAIRRPVEVGDLSGASAAHVPA